MDELSDSQFGDDEFWSLVTAAKQDFDAFTKKLENMNREQLLGFAHQFEELAGYLYDFRYHQNRFSEDYLEDLCGWVVGQGKEFYTNVRNNPDQMPEEVDYSDPGIEIEFQASKIFHDKFNEEMPLFDGG